MNIGKAWRGHRPLQVILSLPAVDTDRRKEDEGWKNCLLEDIRKSLPAKSNESGPLPTEANPEVGDRFNPLSVANEPKIADRGRLDMRCVLRTRANAGIAAGFCKNRGLDRAESRRHEALSVER